METRIAIPPLAMLRPVQPLCADVVDEDVIRTRGHGAPIVQCRNAIR